MSDDSKPTGPVALLIEKVSSLVGGLAKPWQIKRVVSAEAEARVTLAKADIEISELQQRALMRLLAEETRRQENIESVLRRALPEVSGDADVGKLDDDWLVNFFDKCRIVV